MPVSLHSGGVLEVFVLPETIDVEAELYPDCTPVGGQVLHDPGSPSRIQPIAVVKITRARPDPTYSRQFLTVAPLAAQLNVTCAPGSTEPGAGLVIVGLLSQSGIEISDRFCSSTASRGLTPHRRAHREPPCRRPNIDNRCLEWDGFRAPHVEIDAFRAEIPIV